jgi:hypothetical protein
MKCIHGEHSDSQIRSPPSGAPSQYNVTISEVKFAIDNTLLSVVYILLDVAYVKDLLDLSDQTNHERTCDKEYKKGARF